MIFDRELQNLKDMGILAVLLLFLAAYFGFQDRSRYLFSKYKLPLKGLDVYYNSVRNSLINKEIKASKDEELKQELEYALKMKRA